MIEDKWEHGYVRYSRDLPSIVELSLGDGFEAVLSGEFPVTCCARAWPHDGHRVFADRGLYTSAGNRRRPFTDADDARVVWQLRDHRLGERCAPAPVIGHNLGIAAVGTNAVTKRVDQLGDRFRSGAFRAARTILRNRVAITPRPPMREAVGVVLRHGDGEDASQAGCLLKHMAEAVANPVPYHRG